jgi:pyrimidine-nucleoside phosphorylase
MTAIGELAGRKVKTLLSDMNQPLGFAVGNVLEVKEALQTLLGGGPADFREHCLQACAHMLVLGGRAAQFDEARFMAEKVLANGSALQKFRQLVAAQGGDVSFVDQPEKLTQARFIETIASPEGGYISQVHARLIGEAAVNLGAGRAKKSDLVDHAVGFEILHKVGDYIQVGDPLFVVHANEPDRLRVAAQAVLDAHLFSTSHVQPLPLFYN